MSLVISKEGGSGEDAVVISTGKPQFLSRSRGLTSSLFFSVCAQPHPTLCYPMDCSPPGSSVHGISQARILERGAISSSRGSSRPRDRTRISCTGKRILYPLSHLGSPAPVRACVKYMKHSTFESWLCASQQKLGLVPVVC